MGAVFLGIIVLIAGFVVHGLDKQTSDKANLKPLGWLLKTLGPVIVVFGAVSSSVVIIDAGYVGVRLRLGATAGQLGQGLHFLTPGVERVVLMEVRTQKEESQATAASRDLQTVTATLALNFRVDESRAAELYRSVGTEYKTRVIDPAVQEAIKVVTAQYTAEDLIRQRGKVKNDVELEITNRLKQYELIVEPGGLSITNFEFSPEFNKAIESKQIALQEAEKQRFVLQRAELEKQTRIAQAQGEAEAAKLNAQALQANGGGLVVAREWIEKWDGKLPSVAGGSGQGGFILDLKTLLEQAETRQPAN